MRNRILSVLLSACFAGTASAQPGELTHELSRGLLVEVGSTSVDSRGAPEPALPAAGTIIGQRNDTLFIVTTHHHIAGAAFVDVRITRGGPQFRAAIPFRHPGLDIAVLAITGYEADPSWRLPARVLRERAWPYMDERVFAIGCPEGQCWVRAERGEISGARGPNLHFRTFYIKPGVSGGPLVAADGSLLGIVVKTQVAEGTAVWWPAIEEIIQRHGYPVNLPVVRGFRIGEVSVRLFGAAFPQSGANSDGARLQPGWRGELTVRVAPRVEIAGGLNRVSFAASPYEDFDAGYAEAYAHVYTHAGIRYSLPITRWSIGRGLPDVASAGIDLLVPLKRDTEVVGMVASDSVDLAWGEYVDVRSVIEARAGISFALRGSYRLALTQKTAVVVAPSLYLMNFDYLLSSPLRGFLEIGGDFRLE